MSDATKQSDWTRPAAMAIPKGGFFEGKVEQGRYGPIFPKSPACYGFSILAKVIPGREERFYEYARTIEQAVADQPDCSRSAEAALSALGPLCLSRAKPISCTRASSTPTSTNTPRMRWRCFTATGLKTVFENLEDFPADWETNPPAFIKFVRDHQCPSFLEYGEYPYVSADEIKKALRLKAAFSNMLDQMQ